MLTGLSAGILWALDTVILGIALSLPPFSAGASAAILAPLICTFLHDAFSSLWMLGFTAVTKQFKNVYHALRSKSGRFILLGALLGGPIGMSGYVAAIQLIGPGYTAVISSLYPALGALLSYLFLKEKMRLSQLVGLLMSIAGVIALGYTSSDNAQMRLLPGFLCAALCCVGWASEGVICAYGMKDSTVTFAHALQIRQPVSAICYALIILPAIGGWQETIALPSSVILLIVVSAFCGTASYLCYYRTIAKIGPPKAMALNITYSAWSLVFSFFFLHTIPDKKSLFFAVVVLAGALLSALEFPHRVKQKN